MGMQEFNLVWFLSLLFVYSFLARFLFYFWIHFRLRQRFKNAFGWKDLCFYLFTHFVAILLVGLFLCVFDYLLMLFCLILTNFWLTLLRIIQFWNFIFHYTFLLNQTQSRWPWGVLFFIKIFLLGPLLFDNSPKLWINPNRKRSLWNIVIWRWKYFLIYFSFFLILLCKNFSIYFLNLRNIRSFCLFYS